MNKIRDFFLRIWHGQDFIRNVMVLAGSTALSQGFMMLASPVLTRLYHPSDFGVLTVYTSILAILAVVTSLRYELAIPLPENDRTAASVLVLSFLILPIVSSLVGVGLLLWGDWVVILVNTPALKPCLWFLPLSLLGTGAYKILNYWTVRNKGFDYIARTKLSQSIGQVVAQVGLGLLKTGPIGLLLGSLVGLVSGCGTLYKFVYKQEQLIFHGITLTEIRNVARRYRRFPLLSSGSALLNVSGLQLPTMMIASFYGSQVVGWLGLSRRIIRIPMILVGWSVADVFLGEAARLAQEDIRAMHGLFWKTVLRLLWIGFIPIAILGFSGPWLFAFVFGDAWRESGVYVQILAVMFLAEFVVTPISHTLIILERQELQLLWDIGRLLIAIFPLWLSNFLNWSPSQALTGYSVCMLIAYLGLLMLSNYAIKDAMAQEKVCS